MNLAVKLTGKAALDIARNFNWLAENRSDEVAVRWRIELAATFRKLAVDAPGCPEAAEAEWLGTDIRQYLHGRRNIYRILFRIRDETVEILRVRHSRQDFLGPDDM